MGRRKKSKAGANESAHELEELRLSFLELCGVNGLNVDETRLCLMEALQTWRSLEEDDFAGLEEMAAQLHTACSEFLEYLVLEVDEVHDIYNQLERRVGAVQEVLTYRSILSVYQKEVGEEELLVETIRAALDNLHLNDPNEDEAISPKIGNWLTRLKERRCMKGEPWIQAARSFLSSNKDTAKESEGALDHHRTDRINDEEISHDHETAMIISQAAQADQNNQVVPSFDNIKDEVKFFLDNPHCTNRVVLLNGPSGSGKSYLCDEIKCMCHGNIRVVTPSLLVDLSGARLGDNEKMLLSLFTEVSETKPREKVLLLLDDLDKVLLRDSEKGDFEEQLANSVVEILDKIKGSSRTGQALVVCTSTNDQLGDLCRFDTTYSLSLPDEQERHCLITRSFDIDQGSSTEEENQLLQRLAERTLGRSRAEIAQYCRLALLDSALSSDTLSLVASLKRMEQSLNSLAPQSLRSGIVDGHVDMVVYSTQQLQAMYSNELPLFGQETSSAWNQLMSTIVLPLCQSAVLDKILFGGKNEEPKIFCGGVLLTGQPGTGKSELAKFTARFASSLLPGVKLLDVSCTSLVHKQVGGSERAVRRLFQAARAAAPCILLMDGIENIAAVRGYDNTTEGTMDRVLSTLLTELDGVETVGDQATGGRIAVIGVTHNKDWIDPALRRAGRLEKVIGLASPDFHARRKIVTRELLPFRDLIDHEEADVDFDGLVSVLAERTGGLTGAGVVAVCNDGRMQCLKEAMREQNSECGDIQPVLMLKHFVVN